MSEQHSQIGWSMTEPTAALTAFLDTLPTAPQLLGLGEPTHGVEAFPAQRNRIFQSLVTAHGFRSIAIESDILAGLRVNEYVTSGQATLDDVMNHGFSHSFGQVQANRDLLVWMRQFNAGSAEADRVSFYGFDPPIENRWAASPRLSLLSLHDFLARHFEHLPADSLTIERLCGDDTGWTNQAAAMDPAQSIGGTPEAQHLRVLADDLLAFLETQRPGQTQADLWEAQLYARTARGLLRYHANLAAHSPDRLSQMLALRAVMMAENLMAIAEREKLRGPTLVFAHNSHLQRTASQIRMDTMTADWWPAGTHLDLGLGQKYAVITSTSGEDTEVPTTLPDTGQDQQYSRPYLYATASRPQADGMLFLPGSASPA